MTAPGVNPSAPFMRTARFRVSQTSRDAHRDARAARHGKIGVSPGQCWGWSMDKSQDSARRRPLVSSRKRAAWSCARLSRMQNEGWTQIANASDWTGQSSGYLTLYSGEPEMGETCPDLLPDCGMTVPRQLATENSFLTLPVIEAHPE